MVCSTRRRRSTDTQPRSSAWRWWFARSLGSGLRWLVCAVGLVLAGWACSSQSALEDYGPAPTFALQDQTGQPFSSDQLAGRVALADFIYTSCQDTCPLLTANMARVQDRLKREGLFGERVVLLSFSLDPERDTPAVLAQYGARFGADESGWKLLTGQTEVLAQLAQDFKLGRPIPLPPSAQNPAINLAHSNRFILIDQGGRVRGYYAGEDLDTEAVLRDIRRLLG